MTFKLNISSKGKAWKLESEAETLVGKSIGDKFDGKEINVDLEGYEFEITGGSDKSGFAMYKEIEGIGLRRVLLKKGEWGLHKRPKGVRKKVPQSPGLRMRKTYRGKTISEAVIQININVLKEGSKKLKEIFPDQNVIKAPEVKEESNVEEVKVEEKKEESKEEQKTEERVEEVKAEEVKEDEKAGESS
jgi:small subunit ribosomal protein S6e